MKNTKYDHLADKHKPKENKMEHVIISFLSGGMVGLLGEVIIEVLVKSFPLSRNDASSIMIVLMIFLASLCTALGFFDKWVHWARAGLIVPITGFAHSMMSASLEYKKDGMVTGIGANMFKLAGSVIVYGVVSSYVFGLIRFLIFGG